MRRKVAIRWREVAIASDGKPFQKLKYKALGDVSMREANDELRRKLAAASQPRQCEQTFREHGASWKTNVLPQYPKHSTRKHHADILDNKLIRYFGEMLLKDIMGEHIQQFIRLMVERDYSPHSIHHYHTVLSTVLSKAVEWKRISSNPAIGVELPEIKPVREQHYLDYRQAQELLELLPTRPRVAVALALSTGARRGELFALRWKHLDPVVGQLSIVEAIYDGIIDRPKTKGSVRTIPISQDIVRLLLQWRSQTKYSKPDDFILAGRQGISGDHARLMRDYIKPTCDDLGVPPSTWLTFRRTWATWAAGKGISPKTRGALMGNSPDINDQVYTKVLSETLRPAVEVVGKELFSNCSVWLDSVN